jgi:isoquinoline 1-oxidoreductase beta subunit
MTGLARRDFVKVVSLSATGVALGFSFSPRAMAAVVPIDAWLGIQTNSRVTIKLAKAEMGQGVYTALPAIIADELGVNLDAIDVEFGGNDPRIVDSETGASPITGGSGSIRGGHLERLRRVGATMREMVRSAAAKEFGADIAQVAIVDGVATLTGSSRTIPIGSLAAKAAGEAIPQNPPLKPASELRYVGKEFPRLDTPKKVAGTATFGIDVDIPNLHYGAVKYCPSFKGEVENLTQLQKDVAAKGGTTAVAVPNGVVVVAKSYWLAEQILGGLTVKFAEDKKVKSVSSATISKALQAGLSQGKVVHEVGSGEVSGEKFEASYEVPFLAHATMEPMNATARENADGSVELWVGHQGEGLTRQSVSGAAGVPAEKLKVYTTFLGGGFGRRALMDHAVAAVIAARTAKLPVKVIYSRATDFQKDGYRPAFAAHFSARLGKADAKGQQQILAWEGTNAGQGVMTSNGWAPPDKPDHTSIEGFTEIHYAIPRQIIKHAAVNFHVPVWFWRSVGSSQNAFFVESFIDELAHKTKRDPLELRVSLLSGRYKTVLETAAEKAEWGKKKRSGFGQGIALAESFGSIVAQVVEVQVDKGQQSLRISRVVCAVDCGSVVNPKIVEAQMMSGVHCGLSSALFGKVTIKDGAAAVSNFDDYRFIPAAEMPPVDVHIVSSGAEMGGVGEPGVPPAAPALANAIFAATGKRIRRLPIFDSLWSTT